MAMNAAQLADEIVAELEAEGFKPVDNKTANQPFFDALARAVVAHIQANAKANVSGGSSAGSHPIA